MISDNPQRYRRRSIRLKGYDYSQPGAYFVTLVTHGRELLFGEIVRGEMQLNRAGHIVQQEWQWLAQRFPNIHLDAFVIMPNHIHAIIVINAGNVGATQSSRAGISSGIVLAPDGISSSNGGSPLQGIAARPSGPAAGSLGALIGQFKSRVTKRLWSHPGLSGRPVWQRNYYEHIIRDESEWQDIHFYIHSNPENWQADQLRPAIGKSPG